MWLIRRYKWAQPELRVCKIVTVRLIDSSCYDRSHPPKPRRLHGAESVGLQQDWSLSASTC